MEVTKEQIAEDDVKMTVSCDGCGGCVEIHKYMAFGGTTKRLMVSCPSFISDDLAELAKHIVVLQRAYDEARALSGE